MDKPPTIKYRPRRLTALCGAALAAALFTPMPATADVIRNASAPTVAAPAAVQSIPAPAPKPDTLALSLISTGMIGLGLAMGGLVIVTHRRRQY